MTKRVCYIFYYPIMLLLVMYILTIGVVGWIRKGGQLFLLLWKFQDYVNDAYSVWD